MNWRASWPCSTMFCSRPGWSRPRPMVASGDYPEGFLELGNRGPAGKSGTQENHLVREERDRAGRGSGPCARSPSKKVRSGLFSSRSWPSLKMEGQSRHCMTQGIMGWYTLDTPMETAENSMRALIAKQTGGGTNLTHILCREHQT